MARPPASKSQKIRTGNYYLSWSGLIACSFQCLPILVLWPAVTAAASTSQTSGHSSMVIDGTPPGQPLITETFSELNHFALILGCVNELSMW